MKMKNKQQQEIAARKAHKTQLKLKREPINLQRIEANRVEIKSFLIFTEGKNTEPSYFKQFKLPTLEMEVLGLGMNTFSLIEAAVKIRDKKNKERQQQGKSKFGEVWCVLDTDPNLDNVEQVTNFTNALTLAKQKDIKIAYSNQAFEYWFILHFEDHQGGCMHRADYADKINAHLKVLGCHYDARKSKLVSEDFFDQMLVIVEHKQEGKKITRQDKAIQRAKKILIYHEQNYTLPVYAESSTTVFQLVEALNQYMNK
jgi:hypothetical protein